MAELVTLGVGAFLVVFLLAAVKDIFTASRGTPAASTRPGGQTRSSSGRSRYWLQAFSGGLSSCNQS